MNIIFGGENLNLSPELLTCIVTWGTFPGLSFPKWKIKLRICKGAEGFDGITDRWQCAGVEIDPSSNPESLSLKPCESGLLTY